MKKNFTILVFSLFLFVAHASADQFYTITDNWDDWPGFNSNIPEVDELGTPAINRMEITLSDSGLLKNDVMGGKMNPVPEPATMALLGIGLLGLAGIARRHTR